MFATSLAMIREIRDGRGEPIVLGRMGTVALAVGDPARAQQLHEQALSAAVALGERREQSYQLLGLGNAVRMRGDLQQAEEWLRDARDLDVPETGYMAALSLGVVQLRSGRRTEAGAAFDCTPEWDEEPRRAALLAPALAECRQAIATCPGRGAVRAVLQDVAQLAADGVPGLEPMIDLLRGILVG